MREGIGQGIAGGYASKMAYDNEPNCKAPQQIHSSEVERELGSIESIIELMAKQTSVLEERLRLVLHPESPSTGSCATAAPTSSVPLAAGLGVFRSKLSYLSQRLEALTQRLDF